MLCRFIEFSDYNIRFLVRDKTGRKRLPLGPISPSSVPSGEYNMLIFFSIIQTFSFVLTFYIQFSQDALRQR